MKSEIDALMQANNLDVLLVLGNADHNSAMVYFTGIRHVSTAFLIKKSGQAPILYCYSMERDEAARSGLQTHTFSEFPYKELIAEACGDSDQAYALTYVKVLQTLGITHGKVGLYGRVDFGELYDTIGRIKAYLPDIEFVGYMRDPILMPAMMTKEEAEVEHIRAMGKITTEVVGRVAEWITHQSVHDNTLYLKDGAPLTIGKVKSKINLWLTELGAENPEGTIFAQGRDAGVPHSAGTPDEALQLGKTIVFDIYPCEVGGGYYYDFTRTWSLGYATDETQKLYQDVRDVYTQLIAGLRPSMPFREVQIQTCDLFETLGHPTVKSRLEIEEGYVHSIGHGVGLRVHELPISGLSATEQDMLLPGTIFTLEPGLYYPSRGMGMRLEDTFYSRPDGTFEILSDYPLDFVLPIK